MTRRSSRGNQARRRYRAMTGARRRQTVRRMRIAMDERADVYLAVDSEWRGSLWEAAKS